MTLIQRLSLLLGLSLSLSFFTWGRRVLFPFQIFTTWIHECCHGMAALILGGNSIRITLSSDGGGLTHYKIPSGKLRHAVIASAGYLGASASGCFIFFMAVSAERPSHLLNTHWLVISLGTLIGLSLLFWIRNPFGFFSVLILGGALVALNYPPMNHYAQEILLFLSIQTALNSLFDIRTLFAIGVHQKGVSDAHIMQNLFYLPHWFWAISWLTISMFMMYLTIRYVV
jgi:hypothetical protein